MNPHYKINPPSQHNLDRAAAVEAYEASNPDPVWTSYEARQFIRLFTANLRRVRRGYPPLTQQDWDKETQAFAARIAAHHALRL
jgi:hypothetical protein